MASWLIQVSLALLKMRRRRVFLYWNEAYSDVEFHLRPRIDSSKIAVYLLLNFFLLSLRKHLSDWPDRQIV